MGLPHAMAWGDHSFNAVSSPPASDNDKDLAALPCNLITRLLGKVARSTGQRTLNIKANPHMFEKPKEYCTGRGWRTAIGF